MIRIHVITVFELLLKPPRSQVLSTRKRKDVAEADVKVQVCLFGFDLLYLNGESLVTRPFQVISFKYLVLVLQTWQVVLDPD
jgi:hypothetical protein